MSAVLLVVTGTGTGIGKTHATAAIVRAWARALAEAGVPAPRVAALKPVESGVSPGAASDALTLEQASTFHVKRVSPPYMLARPVSPHLAARDEGQTITLDRICAYVAAAVADADAVAVELPGGLFSPLAPELSNADVARALGAASVVLVAPDRLGVLHDVAATTRAASALGLAVSGIVLVAPEHDDASTGTNANELSVVTAVPVLAVLPRADVETLSVRDDVAALVHELVRSRPRPRPR
jgi:dethiobiotin synthetase